MSSLYATLGVDPSATETQIKKAYREKVVALHPDKHDNTPEITERFREVQHAYEVLGNPERRAEYDITGVETERTRPVNSNPQSGSRTSLVVSEETFVSLFKHTLWAGSLKNLLLLAMVLTVISTAGWWGWVLGAATFFLVGRTSKNWLRLVAESTRK